MPRIVMRTGEVSCEEFGFTNLRIWVMTISLLQDSSSANSSSVVFVGISGMRNQEHADPSENGGLITAKESVVKKKLRMSINSKSATNAALEHKEAAKFSASPMFTDCQHHQAAISKLRYISEDLNKLTHRSGIRSSKPLTREEPKSKREKFFLATP
ncbi:hypothetical protein AVEN_229978-1 [Araneus ventricosus]|uniref:Uncharacterized protein n=1 Tax=Araneus ventricosus TaxID=182803 RepID=A0A4Y2BWJ7_ARAVE|nr:hypothetical protein AVEN_229978-1 [Araneus ventricosus]